MIVKHNYVRSRERVSSLFIKWGRLGALRRVGEADQQVWVGTRDLLPSERLKVNDPEERMALISAIAPDGAVIAEPSREKDRLVLYVPDSDPLVDEEILRIMTLPGKLHTGPTVLYWKFNVRR